VGTSADEFRSHDVKKHEVLELLENFPDDVDAEELMYRLYLREKLERAEAAVDNGDVVRHEEVVRQTQQWLK